MRRAPKDASQAESRKSPPKKEIVEPVASRCKTPAEIDGPLKIHRGTVSRIVSQARAGV